MESKLLELKDRYRKSWMTNQAKVTDNDTINGKRKKFIRKATAKSKNRQDWKKILKAGLSWKKVA